MFSGEAREGSGRVAEGGNPTEGAGRASKVHITQQSVILSLTIKEYNEYNDGFINALHDFAGNIANFLSYWFLARSELNLFVRM